MSFLARYTTNPRYAPLLIDVCSVVFGLYTPVLGQSEAIDELFTKLGRQVKSELKCQRKMLEVVGCMDAIINGSGTVRAEADMEKTGGVIEGAQSTNVGTKMPKTPAGMPSQSGIS